MAQASQQTAQVTLNIDGTDHQVPSGMNLVDALQLVGKEIPHYCYHSKLSIAGNCRMCLVETGTPRRDHATGALGIAWAPKPAIACATPATPGLHVRTGTPLVKNCRESITEFLLLNHPLDCPICDKAGECHLQEYSATHGRGCSRTTDDRNNKPKKIPLGPRILHDAERCILCARCIRFCNEIARDPVLAFTQRGSRTTLACHPNHSLANNYSLNTVDICPVGALTSTDFRFRMRVWFLKQTPGICPESSAGVNTTIWSREGKIHRITPRRNDAVNAHWMPDSGRALYKLNDAPNRIRTPLRDGVPVPLSDAIETTARLLRTDTPGRKVGIVASGHLSLEEQAHLSTLANHLQAPVWLPPHLGENDGLLLTQDRTPNTRGAFLAGLITTLPPAHTPLGTLAHALAHGAIETLLVLREDLTQNGIPPELLRKSPAKIITIATHTDGTTPHANIVIPAPTVFEKEGTFANAQFRLQRFHAAIPPPGDILPETHTIDLLLHHLAHPGQPYTPQPIPTLHRQIWEKLTRAPTSPLHGLTPDRIPPGGHPLDPAPWAHIPFPDTTPRRLP
jgi:NADH-quinone oxidoreductase subunit G